MKKINYETVANDLIEYLCECNGTMETIGALVGIGLTKDELIFLSFDEEDIDEVLSDMEKD